MIVRPSIRPLRDSAKPVQVELSLKGRQLSLLEVSVEDEINAQRTKLEDSFFIPITL